MSASREKKVREEQDSLAQKETKKKSKKLSEGWIFAICMVAVVVIVFGGMFIFRSTQAHKTVLTVGDHDVEVSEFNFFYRELASSCDAYSQYIGVEKNVPLDEQKVEEGDLSMLPMLGINTDYMQDKEAVDGVYDVTWAQLLSYNAMRNAASVYAVYQEAMEAGYELSEKDAASIESALESVQLYADQNNMSTDEYLERVFGHGSNDKTYRQYLEVVNIAQHYPDSLEYTDAEREARYEKNPEKFDTADFYYYSVSGAALGAIEDEKEEKESAEELDAKARASAEEMAENFDVESEKIRIYADMTADQMKNPGSIRTSEEARTWIFNDAKDGDVKMFTVEPEAEDGSNTYIVVKMIRRGSYNTSDYLQIVIPADPQDKELAEGELSAADKVAAIKASLKEDPSEENFRKNVHEYVGKEQEGQPGYDASREGLVEDMDHSQMAGISNSFYTWAAMGGRSAGDITVEEKNGITRFYFYLGEGEDYQKLLISAVLKQEWFESVTGSAMDACEYDEKAAMSSKVGFYNA